MKKKVGRFWGAWGTGVQRDLVRVDRSFMESNGKYLVLLLLWEKLI